MKVAYVGNFRPPFSTENHVRDALRSLGHDVVAYQEDDFGAWDGPGVVETEPDFVLWTHTYGLAAGRGGGAVAAANRRDTPIVGHHLDRWWGLDRQSQIGEEPFFTVDLLVTADGGHVGEWQRASINHVWLPPAVAVEETERVGVYDERFADYDIAFVGTWAGYHPEWPYRETLVQHLLARWPGRFRPFCCNWRGQDLANLMATVPVIVGDSCLANSAARYWSDRIPETLGRAGFLVHPAVDGLADWYDDSCLATYPIGDFAALDDIIGDALGDTVARHLTARRGQDLVRSRDTYTHRMAAVVDMVRSRSDLSDWMGPVTVTNQGCAGTFDVRRPGDGIVLEEVWHQNTYQLRPDEVAGRTVVDIGANIGDFAVWCAAAGAAKVWAYEPDEDNRAELVANLALNPAAAERIVVVGEAVHDHDAPAWMTDKQGRARVVDAPASLMSPDRVVAGRHVDVVLERAGSALVVKIDCEGCEYRLVRAVLPGHLQRIDKLVMEFHSGPDFGGESEMPGTFGPLVTKLASQGEVFIIGDPKKGGMLWWKRFGVAR